MKKEVVEKIVTREFRRVLPRKTSRDKQVPGDRQYGDDGRAANQYSPEGLCKTCDWAPTCQLPGRITGVWHCNEFQ